MCCRKGQVELPPLLHPPLLLMALLTVRDPEARRFRGPGRSLKGLSDTLFAACSMSGV